MITVIKQWDSAYQQFWYKVMDGDNMVKLFSDPDKAIEFAAGLSNPTVIPDEVIYSVVKNVQ